MEGLSAGRLLGLASRPADAKTSAASSGRKSWARCCAHVLLLSQGSMLGFRQFVVFLPLAYVSRTSVVQEQLRVSVRETASAALVVVIFGSDGRPH